MFFQYQYDCTGSTEISIQDMIFATLLQAASSLSLPPTVTGRIQHFLSSIFLDSVEAILDVKSL